MPADILPQLHDAAPIIVSLVIIEGLLSVDNMLAIAALASNLPESQKRTALRLGLIGAYVFRTVALLFVSFIISNPWLKILGAAYLLHLMAQHFTDLEAETDEDPGTHAAQQVQPGANGESAEVDHRSLPPVFRDGLSAWAACRAARYSLDHDSNACDSESTHLAGGFGANRCRMTSPWAAPACVPSRAKALAQPDPEQRQQT